MSGFRLSRHAERDLEEIADYLADRSPSAAVRQLEELLNKFVLLGRNPSLGEVRKDLPNTPRSFVAGNFVVLYRPTTTGIEVARVVHAARDLRSLLSQE